VEKKRVLHRDISSPNILINHTHFEGPDDSLKFIDNILGESFVTFHFVLKLNFTQFLGQFLGPRVQVILTGDDNAMDSQWTEGEQLELYKTESVYFPFLRHIRHGNHGKRGCCGVSLAKSLKQGTPAFIAEALAHLNLRPDKDIPFPLVQGLNDIIPRHPLEDRDRSDVDFFKALVGYNHLNDEQLIMPNQFSES
jgi:serine/threonine protein kinase